jgi:hypothetical protein
VGLPAALASSITFTLTPLPAGSRRDAGDSARDEAGVNP